MVPKLLYTCCPGEVIDVDDAGDGPLPEPCLACGKPASPFVETESGPLCFTCADGPGPIRGIRAAEALGLEPEGDDDGPDGGPTPAAPALAPVDLAVAAARSVRPFTHLSELSDAERAEYEAWAEEVEASLPAPEPCCRCNCPASPYEDTPDGPLCFRCWPPQGPTTRPARAALAAIA